jgi:trans-aconitate methyltransferase
MTGALLEVGCGTGNTLRVMRDCFPRATLIGMDAFHAGLLHARNRTEAALVAGRLEEMPFGRRFALIGMFDVLEHIADDAAALRRIHESLDRSGTLILTVPASPCLWSRFDDESHHQRRYTASKLRDVLQGAGFHVEYMTHFMSVTYPALWLSRRLERLLAVAGRRSGREPAIARELRVPFAVNALLARLLRLEAPAIRRRYRLPLGSSLLAIART